MLTRKQIKKNNAETFKYLGRQFYEQRLNKGITLEQLAIKTKTPPHYFDNVESGNAYLSWGMINYLAGIYDCKIKIELIPNNQELI